MNIIKPDLMEFEWILSKPYTCLRLFKASDTHTMRTWTASCSPSHRRCLHHLHPESETADVPALCVDMCRLCRRKVSIFFKHKRSQTYKQALTYALHKLLIVTPYRFVAKQCPQIPCFASKSTWSLVKQTGQPTLAATSVKKEFWNWVSHCDYWNTVKWDIDHSCDLAAPPDFRVGASAM